MQVRGGKMQVMDIKKHLLPTMKQVKGVTKQIRSKKLKILIDWHSYLTKSRRE